MFNNNSEVPAEGEASPAPTYVMEGPPPSAATEESQQLPAPVTAEEGLGEEMISALADLPPLSPLSDYSGYLTPPDTVISQNGMSLEDMLWEAGFEECATPTESEEKVLFDDWLAEE